MTEELGLDHDKGRSCRGFHHNAGQVVGDRLSVEFHRGGILGDRLTGQWGRQVRELSISHTRYAVHS
jgi:hypothetical protein